MPQLFIIDDNWTHQQWISTGGTRAKKFLQAPDGDFYYFKRSQLKPGKDFTFEFWSEIIASEVGSLLGFNMLPYHLAIYGEVAGCICKSMIATDKEELIELVKYLQAFSPNYNPILKDHQKWYTFHMIENSLESVKQKDAMKEVVKVMILDALIGNGDRHQENMAFISTQKELLTFMEKILSGNPLPEEVWDDKIGSFVKKYFETEGVTVISQHGGNKIGFSQPLRFSPIYDSGSSLGRELTEDKMNHYLQNEKDFEAYIDRGKSEIHWQDGQKLSHFDLLQHIMDTPYRSGIIADLQRLQLQWNEEKIATIVMNVDNDLPETHGRYGIPFNRKQFVLKLLTSRFKRLMTLLDA